MSARFYAPGLGAFSQLDTVMGSAQNPLSMNRFLYAHANPATLIDPTGHCAMDMMMTCGGRSPAAGRPAGRARTTTGRPRAPIRSAAWTTTQHSDRERQFASDRGTSRTATNDTGIQNVDERVMRTRGNLSSTIPTNRTETASDGGFDIGGAIHAGLDVLGMVPVLGAIPDLANGGFYALQGDWGNAAFSLAAAVPLAGDVLGAGKLALKYGDDAVAFVATKGRGIGAATTRYGEDAASALTRGADDVAAGARSCVHSFSADTPVATPDGPVPIAELDVGDEVSALDPETGQVAAHAVTATFVHDDPTTGTVTVAGEAIATTPGHRFLTTERGWVEAHDLRAGEHVPSIGGGSGMVGSITWERGPATMYDLTVETVHTFAVGSGGWVVHNCDPFVDLASPERRTHILDGDATGGGHRAGSGLGKSEFPAGWSDDQTMHHISDVATDPSLPWTIQTNGNIRITGVRDSTTISVILNPHHGYQIWTAWRQ